MATDATGTPTAKGIPKFNTATDAPSGKGSNAQMDSIDLLLDKCQYSTDTAVTGEGAFWNGTLWVYQKVAQSNLQTMTKKGTPFAFVDTNFAVSMNFPDGSTSNVNFTIEVPDDYVSGDLVFKVMRRAGASANTAVMRKSSFRFRDAAASTTIDNNVNIDFAPGDTNSHILSATIAAANFAAGDNIRLTIQRLGADAGDTMVAAVALDGCWVEYTGYV